MKAKLSIPVVNARKRVSLAEASQVSGEICPWGATLLKKEWAMSSPLLFLDMTPVLHGICSERNSMVVFLQRGAAMVALEEELP